MSLTLNLVDLESEYLEFLDSNGRRFCVDFEDIDSLERAIDKGKKAIQVLVESNGGEIKGDGKV